MPSPIILKDLLYIDQGNEDYADGELINWTKMELLGKVLLRFCLSLSTPYNIRRLQNIQCFIEQTARAGVIARAESEFMYARFVRFVHYSLSVVFVVFVIHCPLC